MALLYGKHACIAALNNTKRKIFKIFLQKGEATQKLIPLIEKTLNFKKNQNLITILEKNSLENFIFNKLKCNNNYENKPNHQGICIECSELPEIFLDQILSQEKDKSSSLIVILDQVLDIHNVGSIMRTCLAYDVNALILPKNNSPHIENTAMAKIACGALEKINIINVTNIASTIDTLKNHNYWCYGLALEHKNKIDLYNVKFAEKSVIIMGSEESGLRKLTLQKIDQAVYIPISNQIQSLNVNNALNVALYEFNRNKTSNNIN